MDRLKFIHTSDSYFKLKINISNIILKPKETKHDII